MEPTLKLLLSYIEQAFDLSNIEIKTLSERVLTFSSKVRQPRSDDRSCNKTPFFDRWDTNEQTSYLREDDPRYASEEECKRIQLKLLTLLLEATDVSLRYIDKLNIGILNSILGRPFTPNSLKCIITQETITKQDIKKSLNYSTQRLGSYDIPTGYIIELSNGGKHESNNVGWIKPFHANYKLRSILKEEFISKGGNSKSAKNALDKIQVKSYCTDKFTMPPFFSNRDVRWATWPQSNQYASHYDCCMIELELMSQLFEFYGAPELDPELREEIESKRGKKICENSRRCYITGKEIFFKEYLEESLNPTGGKSSYNVSHINPLSRNGKHHYSNIEWISNDGNRIQGNDTVEEIETKLLDSVIYYLEKQNPRGLKNNQKIICLYNLMNDIMGVNP